jgi:Fe-S-cluster containining protein
MDDLKQFPEGMEPIGDGKFRFACHAGVKCYTVCCKNVDMILYPIDIIRLKNSLHIDSSHFLQKYTRLVKGDNPYFPTVMLKINDDSIGACPFLHETGCSVYADRPSACRMYPLERAVDRTPEKRKTKEYYFLTKHSYCLGHQEEKQYSVREWVRDQRLDEYNTLNELWTEMDTLFAANPWQGEGSGGMKQQLAFMVCYDIDRFRKLATEKRLVEQFAIAKDIRRRIARDDIELMKFGYAWLQAIFLGRSSLIRK